MSTKPGDSGSADESANDKIKAILHKLGITSSLDEVETAIDSGGNEELSPAQKEQLITLMAGIKTISEAATAENMEATVNANVQAISKKIYQGIASDSFSEELRSAILRVTCDILATMIFTKTFSNELKELDGTLLNIVHSGANLTRNVTPETATAEQRFKIYQAFISMILNRILQKYFAELTKQSGRIVDACVAEDGVVMQHALADNEHIENCKAEIAALDIETIITGLTADPS